MPEPWCFVWVGFCVCVCFELRTYCVSAAARFPVLMRMPRLLIRCSPKCASARPPISYDEVRSPLLYKRQLWEQSGHWEHYRADMFHVRGGAADALSAALGSGNSQKEECAPPSAACDHSTGHGEQEDGGPDEQAAEFGLKPMNCPGHCLVFASATRSYRDLPVR